MARLAATVAVRHPETDEVVVLTAGSELPEWAEGQFGPHVLDGDSGSGAAPKRRRAKSGDDK